MSKYELTDDAHLHRRVVVRYVSMRKYATICHMCGRYAERHIRQQQIKHQHETAYAYLLCDACGHRTLHDFSPISDAHTPGED